MFSNTLPSRYEEEGLALATQFTQQVSDVVWAAVIGNAGTLIVFRVGGT
jgi:hypothetical protein